MPSPYLERPLRTLAQVVQDRLTVLRPEDRDAFMRAFEDTESGTSLIELMSLVIRLQEANYE